MKSVFIQLFKLVLLFGLSISSMVHAEERAWPIITFTCDKAKNEVKIKNEVKWGSAGKGFPFNAEQGTYNPWDLVNIVDRGKRRLISEKKKLELKCQLEEAEYTFVISPKIFNVNFNGKCGNRLSVKVSILKGSSVLIEDRAMEKFCHGNAPVLKGIKVKASNNKVKFYEVSRSRFY